jgi:hypothetical protein
VRAVGSLLEKMIEMSFSVVILPPEISTMASSLESDQISAFSEEATLHITESFVDSLKRSSFSSRMDRIHTH